MRFKTRAPKLSDTAVETIRGAAHQFIMSGGSLFANGNGDDRDEHIGNVHLALKPLKGDAFEVQLRALNLAFEDREKLWSAAMSNLIDQSDAAFLFGAFVGMELATLGRPANAPAPSRAKNGGTR